MADPQHVEILGEGPRAWNAWRLANPSVVPDLNDVVPTLGQRQWGSPQGGPINLSRARLFRAFLQNATLVEVDLTDAKLIQADLSGARLENADLGGADLRAAIFAQADLKDAKLDNAILDGAQLQHARNLTQAQIDRARGDRKTGLPQGLKRPASWLEPEERTSVQMRRSGRFEEITVGSDPFTILGVSRKATADEIRRAYRRLVKQLHPDRAGDRRAEELLKAVNEAYDAIEAQRKIARQESRRKWHRAGLFMSGACVAVGLGLLGYSLIGLLRVQETPAAWVETKGGKTDQAARDDEQKESEVRADSDAKPQTLEPAPPALPKAQSSADLVPVEERREARPVETVRDTAGAAAWAKANDEGTKAAFRRYVKAYPEGPHAAQARERLAALDALEIKTQVDRAAWIHLKADHATWTVADREGTKAALKRYVTTYPSGQYVAKAEARLAAIETAEAREQADTAAWTAADREGTKAALKNYVTAYPDGRHVAKARTKLAAIETAEAREQADTAAWTAADREGTKAALKGYMAADPDGRHISKAQAKLAAIEAAESRKQADDAAWAAADREGTKAALKGYVTAHPDGQHIAKAQAKLAAIETAEAREQADTAAWTVADLEGTKAALKEYMTAYPDGRHIPKAKQKLAAIETAEAKKTQDSTAQPDARHKKGHPVPSDASLGKQPKERHIKQVRTSDARGKRDALGSALITVKGSTQEPQGARPRTIEAPVKSRLPPSADEPLAE